MSTSGSVFLIGSGLIGGEILTHLLKEDYNVTVLTRRAEAAEQLERRGAKAVQGSLSDVEIIARQSAQHDIILHTATADDLASVEAVLSGIEQRVKAGKKIIYLHTSGASVLADSSNGDYASDVIFYDDKPADINALDDEAPHRKIDLAIVHASRKFGTAAQLAILMPPLVYDIESHNARMSIQVPTLTRFALHQGYAGHVGSGASLTSSIHVADLARGYMTLLHALEEQKTNVLQNSYFFCTNGKDVSWRTFAEKIGSLLHKAGKLEKAETQTIPKDKFNLLFGDYTASLVGMNARCRGTRLEQLGWRAREVDALTSLEEEVIVIMQEDTSKFAGYAAPVASGKK